ncbi:MAG: hypothetical protein IJ371_05350 [Clostridia bacterium]|nr:hypothetical protein [Clostridia bacterium]
MFIEDLWEKNPELFKSGLAKCVGVDASRLICTGSREGWLRFGIKSLYSNGYEDTIIVNDFKIRFFDKSRPEKTLEWMKFMKCVCGDKYLYHYIAHRNEELDRYMANYEEKYNNQTRKVLAELGMDKYKDELNQTK